MAGRRCSVKRSLRMPLGWRVYGHDASPADQGKRLRHRPSEPGVIGIDARERLDRALEWLHEIGAEVHGAVGDARPLLAIGGRAPRPAVRPDHPLDPVGGRLALTTDGPAEPGPG